MSPSRMLTVAAAAAALLSLPAFAVGEALYQAQPNDSMSAPMNDRNQAPMPPENGSAMAGAATDTNATVLDNSQVTSDQARALKTGDNTQVTNGPVPDTAANRARYGKPMSNAGKRTDPAGN